VSTKVRYYAIVDGGATRENPGGIVRRRTKTDGSFQDEALHRDLTWRFSPTIVEWERAESSGDLVEVSEDEAERIIQRFQALHGGTPR
jgi:hypothetical protein